VFAGSLLHMIKRLIASVVVAALLVACDGRPPRPEIQATARYATTAAVVDGLVFVVGGMERGAAGDVTVAAVDAYDPDARSWSRCAPMPTARSFAAAAAFRGKIYVFGGLDVDGQALDVVEVYDPRTDAWSRCTPNDTALSRLTAVNHMDIGIIVAGGMDGDGANSARQRIFLPDFEGREIWREWALPMLPTRHGFGLVDADDVTERIFAVGGYGESGPLADVKWWGVGTVHALDADGNPRWPGVKTIDPETGREVAFGEEDFLGYIWQTGPPLQQARGFLGGAKIGPRIYAVGGRCRGIPRTEVLDLDALSDGWKQAAPLPIDLCRFSLVAWDGHLLAFGGETEYGKTINSDVLEYDPTVDEWVVR